MTSPGSADINETILNMPVQAPSIDQQKAFIIENSGYLGMATQKAILSVVKMEIGDKAVTTTGPDGEPNINLDDLVVANPDVLLYIYNLVRAHIECLSRPAIVSDPAAAEIDFSDSELPSESKHSREEIDDASVKKTNPILPSVSRQKSYIIENSPHLGHKTRIVILSIIMMEVGKKVVVVTGPASEPNINLDDLADVNPDALAQIYGIVRAHVDALNRPAVAGAPE
jgi:hypothetical protein